MASRPTVSVPADVHRALSAIAVRRSISLAAALEIVCGLPVTKRAEVEKAKALWVSRKMHRRLGRGMRRQKLEAAINAVLDKAGAP